jgi:hypothetical protein
MELYEAIRLRQDNIINQNKASVVISRITRTDDGAGGYSEATTTLASQDVRIYNKRSRILNINDGGWHTARQTLMVAKYNANVQKESAIYLDTFTHNSIKYKITDVKPIMTQGYVVFLECAVEEVI